MKAHTKHKFIAVSMLSLFLVGCSNQVSESVVETIPPVTEEQKKTVNTLKSEDVTYTVTEGKVHTNTLGSLSLTAKEDYFAVEFPCEGKDTFQVSFEVADTSLLGFAIANKQKVVIKQFNPYNKNGSFAALTKYLSVEINCPEDASYVYINCMTRFKEQFSVQKISVIEVEESQIETIQRNSIQVGANNIGEFEYGDTTYTNEEYKTHWKTMLEEKSYDMFFFEDCVPTYLDSTPIEEVLGGKEEHFNGIDSFGSYFHSSTKEKPLYESMVILPHTIRGKSTRRYFAYKNVYSINNKLVAFYAVHLVAETHITVTDSQGNYYLSQRLRQEQFAALMEDVKKYDESCILGDFNTQTIQEYDSFLEAGYQIANGSEAFQTRNTLIRGEKELAEGKKDIPADNIVVTSGIKINSFEVLDQYHLNTDHFPVYAELTIKEGL